MGKFRVFLWPLLMVSIVVQAQPAAPIQPVFSTEANGRIEIIGNGSMSCPDTVSNCTGARNGQLTPPQANDNDAFAMAYIDVDNDPSTFNSSSARLTLPDSYEVLWAGLYWGGDTDAGGNSTGVPAPDATRSNRVLLRTPADTDYQVMTGVILGTSTFEGNDYGAFVEVTERVQQAGSGDYQVADIQAGTGGNRYAGWSLVVVYRAPELSPRDLTVFHGYTGVTQNNPAVDIPVSGFTTPPSGTVTTRVGAVAFEGDLGLPGDSMAVNGMLMSGPNNPPDNIFNSSIASLGLRVNERNPSYSNVMAIDIDLFDASSALGNSESNATISLRTGGIPGTVGIDAYFPVVATFSTDLFAPELRVIKSVTDINGGLVAPGDVLEYEITVTNLSTSLDAATLIVVNDPIPALTRYVANSLVITGGANAGAKTDPAGDDQAEFDAGNNRTVFRLGDGADAVNGGTLPVGASSSIRFRVQIDEIVSAGSRILNQAVAEFTGEALTTPLTSISNEVETLVATDTPAIPTLGTLALLLLGILLGGFGMLTRRGRA